MVHAPPRHLAVRIGLLLFGGACARGAGAPASPPDPPTTGDTGTVPVLDVRCEATEHALHATCTWVDLPVDGALTLDDGSTSRPETLPAGSGERVVADLLPATLYRWRVASDGIVAEGVFTTPPLPLGAQVDVVVDGTLSTPLLGMMTPCPDDDLVVVLDPEGGVVDYADIGLHQAGFLEGASFTEDGTLLALSAFPGGVVELDRAGGLLRSWSEDELYGPPHHDAFRRDGYTYVIVQEFAEEVFLDAVQVFDPTGAPVALWRLADHIDPVLDVNGRLEGDYTHANSIFVDELGDWYLSSRHLSAVFKIAGLHAPDAGTVRWILAGDPDEVRIEGTLQLTGGESFVRQHHVHVTPDGHLALFDNRRSYPDPSRALWLDVDERAGTATVVQAWTLPVHCPFQGGIYTTPGGHALATCAPWLVAFELAPDQPEPVATVQVSCSTNEAQAYVPRMIPLEAW